MHRIVCPEPRHGVDEEAEDWERCVDEAADGCCDVEKELQVGKCG